MKKELRQHKFWYIFLCLGLLVGTVAFMVAWPDRQKQRLVIVAMSSFYLLWGVFTHFNSDHISKRVVAEYLMVSLLAGFLLFLLTI